MTPICVAIAVVQDNGRFLVGTRPADVPLAGMAEFPGGKVHAEETPAQAAARECLEESGITVEVGDECFSTVHHYDHGVLEIHFFHCRPVNTAVCPRAPFRWVDAAELASLEFPEANRPLTEMLLRGGRVAKSL